MPVFDEKQEELEHYETMMGVPRGRLAVTMDTITDAMALVPELQTAEADPEGDLVSLTVLADWCVRFSPAVALDPPDGLFLDITGVAHLWGG